MSSSAQRSALSSRLARRSRAAFTLIELLVAATITALLASFIVAIVNNVSTTWNRTAGRLSTEAQARLILDQLALDLGSARFQDDGNVWLAATVLSNTNNTGLWLTTGTTGNQKPANNATGTAASLQAIATGNLGDNSPTSPRFGVAGTWLRFFTTKRGNNTISTANVTDVTTVSAPVAVGYQIIRRRTSSSAASTDIRYLLHRVEVRPAKNGNAANTLGTLDAGFNITSAAYAPATNTAAFGDPGEIKFPTLSSVLAENVIDFGVRLYVRNAATGTLTQIFPSSPSDLTHAATLPPGVKNAAGDYTNCFPEVADVMVRILTDEGARLIAAFEATTPTPASTALPTGVNAQQYWWRLALANSQVFTRRIVINAQSF